MLKGHLEEPCFHHLPGSHEVQPSVLHGAFCSTVLRLGEQHLDPYVIGTDPFLTSVVLAHLVIFETQLNES